jgi:hypothetical protein
MIVEKTFNLADALQSLVPNGAWSYENEDYSTLVWESIEFECPSEEAVIAEKARLQNEHDAFIVAEQEQIAKVIEDKKSALAKLSKLGLTEDEAKAVIGL